MRARLSPPQAEKGREGPRKQFVPLASRSLASSQLSVPSLLVHTFPSGIGASAEALKPSRESCIPFSRSRGGTIYLLTAMPRSSEGAKRKSRSLQGQGK